MTGTLTERDRAVLAAVIQRHILTAEPVSSAQVCADARLGVSAATVRNSMARLEADGFLHHPYTSSGKVPTARAYRFFVEDLMAKPLPGTANSVLARAALLSQATAADQLIKLTAGVLAAVSELLAVTWVSDQAPDRLARVELVPALSRRVLLVAFTASGEEIHRPIDTGEALRAETLRCAAAWINEHGRGLTGVELARLAETESPRMQRQLADLLRKTLAALQDELQLHWREALALEGADNLMAQPEFNDIRQARRLVSILDRPEQLIRALYRHGLERDGLRVVVGSDEWPGDLPVLSAVTVGVTLPDGRPAHLGVVGPLRMPYARIIALLGSAAVTWSRPTP